MPSDLIYREDAKDYARHAMEKGLNVLEYLDEVPAANFRPVVRGKWKKRMEENETPDYKLFMPIWSCSECGTEYYPLLFCMTINFCPNCGADMREES